jgi:hypothetical protein
MSTVHCFTSFNFNYLAKARVLAETLKKHHPDWVMHACLCDREPAGFAFDLKREPFDRVTWADELDIPRLDGWLFGHDVVELCTAVKGTMMRMLLQQGADKVVYLDPDIGVLGSLQPLVAMLELHDVLLTPHQLDPDEERHAILDNEICSLQHGIYNLGFVAVANRGDGIAFADWWEKRLLGWCHDSVSTGIFVDQKWCDLAPGLFGRLHVLRDPGYNVASWNLSQRHVDITPGGEILVNGLPIRFFHFTKLGPVGDTMTQKYARDNFQVYELWAWYRRQVMRHTDKRIPKTWWAYARYANGETVQRGDRLLYRSRPDLKRSFANPFGDDDDCGYFRWLQNEQGRAAA